MRVCGESYETACRLMTPEIAILTIKNSIKTKIFYIVATAPSAAAVASCLSGFVLQSPAAYIPSIFVLQSSPEMTYPAASNST